MAENKPEQEPSIEEILSSIRQIISDDDEPAPVEADDSEPEAAPEEPVAAPEPAPEPEDAPEPEAAPVEEEPEDDILELTADMAEDDEDEINLEDYEVAMEETEPEQAPEPEPAAPPPPVKEDMADEILSEEAKSAALSSMAKLASNMPVSKPAATPRTYDGVTLEDIVRDLLNPMLREWMDENLPPMVERLVQKELEKLARRALDE